MTFLRKLVCGLAGAVWISAAAYGDDSAGIYNPLEIADLSGQLFTKFGASGEYAQIKLDDFKTGHAKEYLSENHIALSGTNPEPGRPNSKGRVYLTFNGQSKISCVNNANLALAQHQNHPSMFNIQVNDQSIDDPSEIDEACRAVPHRLVIVLHPN